jgi:hypothetical protein
MSRIKETSGRLFGLGGSGHGPPSGESGRGLQFPAGPIEVIRQVFELSQGGGGDQPGLGVLERFGSLPEMGHGLRMIGHSRIVTHFKNPVGNHVHLLANLGPGRL